MREILSHPAYRFAIGAASIFVGLTIAGVTGDVEIPRSTGAIIIGGVFVAYGVFNLALGVHRLVVKRR